LKEFEMKMHERKKTYRRHVHELAIKGYINMPDGSWVLRGDARVKDNAMARDYFPQRG
jgi:hypothetical protein